MMGLEMKSKIRIPPRARPPYRTRVPPGPGMTMCRIVGGPIHMKIADVIEPPKPVDKTIPVQIMEGETIPSFLGNIARTNYSGFGEYCQRAEPEDSTAGPIHPSELCSELRQGERFEEALKDMKRVLIMMETEKRSQFQHFFSPYLSLEEQERACLWSEQKLGNESKEGPCEWMTGNQDTSTRHSLDSITLFENTHATNETDSNESCEETEDVTNPFQNPSKSTALFHPLNSKIPDAMRSVPFPHWVPQPHTSSLSSLPNISVQQNGKASIANRKMLSKTKLSGKPQPKSALGRTNRKKCQMRSELTFKQIRAHSRHQRQQKGSFEMPTLMICPYHKPKPRREGHRSKIFGSKLETVTSSSIIERKVGARPSKNAGGLNLPSCSLDSYLSQKKRKEILYEISTEAELQREGGNPTP